MLVIQQQTKQRGTLLRKNLQPQDKRGHRKCGAGPGCLGPELACPTCGTRRSEAWKLFGSVLPSWDLPWLMGPTPPQTARRRSRHLRLTTISGGKGWFPAPLALFTAAGNAFCREGSLTFRISGSKCTGGNKSSMDYKMMGFPMWHSGNESD